MNIAELVQGINLITPPDVHARIKQSGNDLDNSTADIVKLMSHDPAFTMQLLQLANSPDHNASSSIDTAAKAEALLDPVQIRNLALSITAVRVLYDLPNTLVSMKNFWRHSLMCALAARSLSMQVKNCDPEGVFTAGLLHDIGELVIFNRLHEPARNALLLVLDKADAIPLYQAQQQVMGFDHAQVGGELARKWLLPQMLVECISYHHAIRQAQQYQREAALVHLADIIALMAEVGTLDPSDVPPIDPLAWEVTGLVGEDVIAPIVSEIQKEIDSAEKIFTAYVLA